jgi:CheY-like chemotaxis protein
LRRRHEDQRDHGRPERWSTPLGTLDAHAAIADRVLVDLKRSSVAHFSTVPGAIWYKKRSFSRWDKSEICLPYAHRERARDHLEEDGERRANIVDPKSVRVTKNVTTVLIVEKNPDYTQALVKQIRLAGLKPIVAVTGEGGLRMAEACHPDLILLEVELPDMNGLRLVSAIRRNLEADRVPIMAMSAFPHLKSRCLERGCSDFLLKPVKMIDLIARIKKFLR